MNPNLESLERTAEALESILTDLVFVGGTIAGLLIDDPGANPARVTRDVDVVAQIAGAPGYRWAIRTMDILGFQPDPSEGAPVCRWVKDGLLVDLMGTEETPFGESNPWYTEGFSSRIPCVLPSTGLTIFILSGPVFLLTKWVAYGQRGKGNMIGSHDIEDILNVLDGRKGLQAEGAASSASVKAGLRQMAEALLQSAEFSGYCLPSLGDREEMARGVLEAFRELAK